MALDNSHLQYPNRQYGMDHDRYHWRILANEKPVKWPNGHKLALWINIPLQFFPLDQQGIPFKVPGGMTMPYPDLRHFSLRDYGNRVGIYRILEALDKFNLTPTFAINAALVERAPYLMNTIKARGDEVICHGLHMDALHYGGQNKEDEAQVIKQALDTLRETFEQPINGWLSPARNESENTPELLVEQGIQYACNWVNDDMPYPFNTQKGSMWSMPLSNELEDQFIINNNLHSEASYVEQIQDACRFLQSEAEEQGGRILALNIHPWLMGQPHRIGYLETLLSFLSQQDIWSASASDILTCYRHQLTT